MGYIIKKTNYRVVVEPRAPGNFGICSISGVTQSEREWERDCEEIISQIKRHVDGVEHVYTEYDVERYCEHCGASWTADTTSLHSGGCCTKDCEEFLKSC